MRIHTPILLIATLSLVSSASGVTVNIIANTSTGQYVSSSQAVLPEGSVVKYGVLDITAYNNLSESQKQSFSDVSSVFSELGSTTVDASGNVVSTNNQYTLPTGGVEFNQQYYTWVFNSSTPSIASEWGIFTSTSTNWSTGAVQGKTSTLSVNFAEMSAVYGSIIDGSPDSFALQAVPEPTTYAVMAGLAVFGIAVVRRRRGAQQ